MAKKNLREHFQGINFKYGSNAVILIVSVIVITVLFNILIDSMNVKADLTPNRLYSIGPRTEQVLDELDRDIEIFGLFDEVSFRQSDRDRSILELLENYSRYSGGRVTLHYTDPQRDPTLINRLDPDGLMELSQRDFVVRSGHRIKRIRYNELFRTEFNQQTFQTMVTGSSAEQQFTGAIRFVTADVTPAVYFLTGHLEYDLDTEFSLVKQTLQNNNYHVDSLNLLTNPEIPDDTEILVIASPKRDITEDERYLIHDYVLGGGSLLIMVDALQEDPRFPQLQRLLENYNLAVRYDQIKENDPGRHLPQNQYTIIPAVHDNQINSPLNPRRFTMVMPRSRSIEVLRIGREFVTEIPLLTTSNRAVGEPISEDMAQADGPLFLAVAIDYQGGYEPAKVIVIGNSNFIRDDYIYAYQQYSVNAFYFFMNSLFWLRDQEETIYIAPKSYQLPMLSLTQQQAQMIGIVSMAVLPLSILIFGFIVFLRRRHL